VILLVPFYPLGPFEPLVEAELYCRDMPVLISMLRGVNLGSHNRIKMDELRALYKSLKLEDARTYVQSGNVIFRTREKNSPALAKKIQGAIERKFGFAPEVILRTAEEMKQALASNPFARRRDVEPLKVLVTFLAAEPDAEAQAKLLGLKGYSEELHFNGRELYIYFPNGVGKSKFPWSSIEKFLHTTGTARNLNSVTQILQIAVELEEAG
jgi:uncharacterized protein (DUF1697 family)